MLRFKTIFGLEIPATSSLVLFYRNKNMIQKILRFEFLLFKILLFPNSYNPFLIRTTHLV